MGLFVVMVNTAALWKRENLVITIIIAMIAGLFFSRAVLSTGIILLFLFTINAIRGSHAKALLPKAWEQYNYLLLLLFVIPLISGLWSNNLPEWWQRCAVKLPFALLPLVFSFLIINKQQYMLVCAIFILLVFTGTICSFALYINNSALIEAGYFRSVLLQVWMNNDHVLFSWAVVIAILLIIVLYPQLNKGFKILGIIIICCFILFLHLLAARTGLISLYTVGLLWLVKKLRSGNFRIAFLIIGVLISIPILAYFTIPTFHNRALYALYDLQHYSRGNYQAGFSDVSRIVSYEGGISIAMNNFLSGVGFGDISGSMQHFYDSNYQSFPAYNRLLPHNEWLMYFCGAGIFALIIFTYIVFYPLFMNRKFCWISFHFTALICFFTDATFETQNGVFLYCFFLLWIRFGLEKII